MVLTLVVPGLLWPRQVMRDTLFDTRFSALETLLGKGRRRVSAASAEAWWHAWFGSDARAFAAAPLRLSALGLDPGNDNWLCVDPVHLRIDQKGAALVDPALLNVSATEARQLHALLAPLLAPLGELAVTTPSHWHLRLDKSVRGFPAHVHHLIEQSAMALLPGGDEGRPWRQLINEAQMALHGDALNAERSSQGKAIINSIALWGEGRAPSLPQKTALTSLLSDDLIIAGAARLSGLDPAPVPPRFTAIKNDCIVNWDYLRFPAARHDAQAWRDTLQRFEQDWLAPALAALANGELRRIELYGFGDDTSASSPYSIALTMTWFDRYRFWRKPRRLESI